MMRAFLALLRRDLKLAARIGGGAEIALVFFLSVIVVAPFALGPDQVLLGKLAPALIWLAALFATLFGLDRLFQADEEEGALDQLMLSTLPLELVIVAKCTAHWLATGLVLSLAAPLFSVMLNLPAEGMLPLVATLLVGTPAITLTGAIGAAVTVGLRRGGLLMAVLVLPLAVPTLIFGVAAANAALVDRAAFGAAFLLLSAASLVALAVAPFAAAAAVRLIRG
jgi:heme exporter protein B